MVMVDPMGVDLDFQLLNLSNLSNHLHVQGNAVYVEQDV